MTVNLMNKAIWTFCLGLMLGGIVGSSHQEVNFGNFLIQLSIFSLGWFLVRGFIWSFATGKDFTVKGVNDEERPEE